MNVKYSYLLGKYRDLSLPAKASFWYLFSRVALQGISFITIPLFTRLLTPEQFGNISIYQSWSSLLTIFATLTLWGGVFNTGLIKYEKTQEEFVSSLLGLSSFTTIILFMVFLIFKPFWLRTIGLPYSVILLIFIGIFFSTPQSIWLAKQRFDYKYKKVVILSFVSAFSNPILGIFFIKYLNQYDAGFARILSIIIVQVCIGITLYVSIFNTNKKLFNIHYWKFALVFNLPLIPHYLSQTILSISDQIMINNLIGSGEAGIYSIAYRLGMISLIIITSINSSIVPWIYKNIKNGEHEHIPKTVNKIIIILSGIILLLIIVAPEVIKILTPVEYHSAIWVIPPIALSVFFIFLQGLFANIEFFYSKTIFIMIASISAALVNVILNLIFLPFFGFLAAGYTTLFSYIVYAYSHYIFMNKVIKKNTESNLIIYDGKTILGISVLIVVLGLSTLLLYNFMIIRYLLFFSILTIAYLKRSIISKILKRDILP